MPLTRNILTNRVSRRIALLFISAAIIPKLTPTTIRSTRSIPFNPRRNPVSPMPISRKVAPMVPMIR